jgi:hypothetical protein
MAKETSEGVGLSAGGAGGSVTARFIDEVRKNSFQELTWDYRSTLIGRHDILEFVVFG